MKTKKIIAILSTLIIVGYSTYYIYKKFFTTPQKQLYQTTKPEKRTIRQIIHATGTLAIKDNLKIGSLQAGTVKKIFVKETEKVKKGQLLAEIDNGKEDTSVRGAKAELVKSEAELEYQEEYYKRQQELFKTEQISKDFFQQVERTYKKAKADVKSKKANLDKQTIDFNNTKINAPESGTIIAVGITEGQTITTNLDATTLFEIAKDVTKMEAELDIDESDIGQIKEGQKVKFEVGTYLDKKFKGTITEVTLTPKLKNNILAYKAKVAVDNSIKLLRPGMTINAKIRVAKAKDCLSITNQAFQINEDILEKIAEKINYQFDALDKKRKKEIEKSNKDTQYTIKYVWVVKDKMFVETAIKINVTDDNYFEVKSGLSEEDDVVIDIEEPDEMEAMYKKFFKSAV